MKLHTLFTTAALVNGYTKKAPKNDALDGRLRGKIIPSESQFDDDGCPMSMSPAIDIFSTITNQLGPQVMSNLFLESIDNQYKNIIASPLTLANQLAILYEGTNGNTREQIKRLTLFGDDGQLMALKELQDQYSCLTKGKITTKNGLFLDESFRPKAPYYHALKGIEADMFKVDFATEPELARVLVDSWSSNFSENPSAVKLPEGSVRPSTSFMMMSSAEFEAKWKIKFDNGGLGGFLMLDGTTKVVKMMDATYPMQHIISCTDNPKYLGCEPNEAIPTMVQIPLESNRLQVVVMKPNKVLPKEALVALSPEYFHDLWLPSADQNLKTVKLRMPKIDIESQQEMSNALFGMGIEDVFLPFRADFSPLTDDVGISLSNIYQQSYLKWDLDGTAAGVVNAMTIKLPWSARSDMLPATDHEASIMIDEPFVVFITDRKTKTNLFIGVVNDPR